MPQVLFVGEQGDSALPYYRQRVPGAGLARRGWKVSYAPILVERHDHRLTGWRGMPFPYEPIPSVVVVRHLVDPTGDEADSAAMFAAAARAGQYVFYDLDDDLWQLPEDNPAVGKYGPEALRVLEENLRWCAGVLASTEELARAIATHTDTPVWVCPNGIEVNDFPRPHRKHDPIRVGWTGMTRWRARDLRMIVEPLAEALTGRAVEFWHVGAGASGGRPIERILGSGFPVPVRTVEWANFARYGAALANLDLAVVPMVDEPVNRSRSPSTGLALGACGVPFVASPLPAYMSLANLDLCALAGTGDEWVGSLRAMLGVLEHFDEPIGARIRDTTARFFGPSAVAAAWANAFDSARRRRTQPVGR